MQQYFKLAWRNLWRNRRRTLITLASVLMAVVLAIGIRSFQKGVYGNMIGNAVRFSTGYIQVHAKGYWEDQSINNSFEPGSELKTALNKDQNISLTVPRLESFALASSGPHTKGVEVIGIDPAKEEAMNNLKGKIIAGKYFRENVSGQGILIGDGMAHYLQLNLGDTLVLLGQGYHGSTAAGQYRDTRDFSFSVGATQQFACLSKFTRCANAFWSAGVHHFREYHAKRSRQYWQDDCFFTTCS